MERLATVDEVWLFGSGAREESDDGSDVDLLVVSDERALPKMVTERLVEQYGENVDVAHYSYAGLAMLVEQGALFTWHLRKEGVPLDRSMDRLQEMLANMDRYDGHERDMEVLSRVFSDAIASLHDGWAVQFDLGVVGTVIRNAGIVMHDLFGSWDFSPAAPIRLTSVPGAPSLPIGEQVYAQLCACRRASERGVRIEDRETLALGELDHAFEQVGRWLCSCLRLCQKERL